MDGFVRKREYSQLNVFGDKLLSCSCNKSNNISKITGFYRDGSCNVGPEDFGLHSVCAIMSDELLSYSKLMGNDLSTPVPEYNFLGLNDGDHWCLCAERWKQAYLDGKAPNVILKSTNIITLSIVNLNVLKKFYIDYLRRS